MATKFPLTEKRRAVFMAKIDATGGPESCWVWKASVNSSGYGKFRVNGRHCTAHRIAYALKNGPIPDGMGVLHHCDNPPCCNPSHLFLGTPADNNADRVAKGRSFHPEGVKHPMAKLTEKIVREIRREHAAGVERGWFVAKGKELGVTHSIVSYIVSGHSWAHLLP